MAEGPDQSYCLLGAQSILKRLADFTRPVAGVREGQDIEFVHKMRVASRRLREAMAMFEPCMPRKKSRNWFRRIRKMTKALGQARDTDVQIQSVAEFIDKQQGKSCRVGLERLLLRLKQQRACLQRKVIDALKRLEESGVVGELEEFCRQSKADSKKDHVMPDSPEVRREAHRAIAARLADLLGYQQYVNQPRRVAELHEMRIAAKHLRYSMEIFSNLYGQDIKGAISVAKQVQSELGGIHDCDMWIEMLPEFVARERARTVEYFGHARPMRQLEDGINLLRDHKKQLRQKLYERFVKHWMALARQDVWGELLETLKTYPEPSRPADATRTRTLFDELPNSSSNLPGRDSSHPTSEYIPVNNLEMGITEDVL